MKKKNEHSFFLFFWESWGLIIQLLVVLMMIWWSFDDDEGSSGWFFAIVRWKPRWLSHNEIDKETKREKTTKICTIVKEGERRKQWASKVNGQRSVNSSAFVCLFVLFNRGIKQTKSRKYVSARRSHLWSFTIGRHRKLDCFNLYHSLLLFCRKMEISMEKDEEEDFLWSVASCRHAYFQVSVFIVPPSIPTPTPRRMNRSAFWAQWHVESGERTLVQ